jgi:hypothetical protein
MRHQTNHRQSPFAHATGRALVIYFTIWIAGCGPSYVRPETGAKPHPVTGQVLIDGTPAEGVLVTFIPEGGPAKDARAATGLTDEEGLFTLSTYNPEDGAPAGKYQVTLSWIRIIDETSSIQDQPPEAQQLPAKFQNPKLSGLTSVVEEGPNDLEPFNVSTK